MNIGISVSRVGGNAQIKAMKKVAGPLKLELAMYRELEAFARFGSDLDASTQQQLRRGARLTEIIKQRQFSPISVDKQIALIFSATNGFMDDLPLESLHRFEHEFFEFLDIQHAELLADIRKKKELTDDINSRLKAAIEKFVQGFKASLK
jgi:F-type H+-transporting ATPase subunit alpha